MYQWRPSKKSYLRIFFSRTFFAVWTLQWHVLFAIHLPSSPNFKFAWAVKPIKTNYTRYYLWFLEIETRYDTTKYSNPRQNSGKN